MKSLNKNSSKSEHTYKTIIEKDFEDNSLVDDTYIEAIDAWDKERKENKKLTASINTTYKLLEEISNGIKFFGQLKTIKGRTTCMAICHCGELWRVEISSIKSGKSKGCGCGRNGNTNASKKDS